MWLEQSEKIVMTMTDQTTIFDDERVGWICEPACDTCLTRGDDWKIPRIMIGYASNQSPPIIYPRTLLPPSHNWQPLSVGEWRRIVETHRWLT